MFGENPMLGIFKRRIDSKGRVIIPIETKREKGDEIYIVDTNEYYLDLLGKQTVLENTPGLFIPKTDDHESELKELLSDEEIVRMELFFMNLVGTSKVDGQGRVIIPQPISNFKINSTVVIQGLGNRLRLYKSEELFEEYKNLLKK